MIDGKLDRNGGTFLYNGKLYDLYPFINMEAKDMRQADKLRKVITQYIKESRNPLLCTSPGLWAGMEDNKQTPLKPGIANDTGLCLVQWTSQTSPDLPKEWEGWVFWEYQNDGSCHFFDDEETLKDWFDVIEEEEPVEDPIVIPADVPASLVLSGDLNIHVYIHQEDK